VYILVSKECVLIAIKQANNEGTNNRVVCEKTGGTLVAQIPVEKQPHKTQRDIISEQITRKFYILTPEGKEYSIDPKNLESVEKALNEVGNVDFSSYVLYNEIKNIAKGEPPSVKEMQQQELLGYAPEADSGHFKFYPKGNLVFELLKEWAYEIAVNRFNCLQIETPIIYDWSDPEIRAQGGGFHERHYSVKAPDDPNKEWVLRFAGDFGLFKIMKKAQLTYKILPIRMYEFSKSFRYEQAGELSGLKRLRGFHMPDIHSFSADINSAWDEYEGLYKQYDDLAKATGIKYVVVFRVVDEFYEKNKSKIIEMLKYSKLPAYVETLSEMKHYWAVKHEFQGIDSVKGSTQLSTVQLDVKDAENYGIVYVDKENTKQSCVIVHSSIGSIERWLYCIIENAFKMEKPMWPFWLAPTQVRICAVSDKFAEDCIKLAKDLNKAGIRTDVDDRETSLSKKISSAEMEWCPYVLVFGEREHASGNYSLRVREDGKQVNMSQAEIVAKLKEKQGEMPWKPLPLPVQLSKRPIFVG